MTDSPNLKGLIERCEQATGPDRELDWSLAHLVGHPSFEGASVAMWPPFRAGSVADKNVPRYTASIDAAVALMERLLPGLFCYEFGWQASALTEVSHDAQLHFTNGEPPMIETSMADAHTLPLAIILATLKALSRIKGDHNDEA
jgi:hypothetical protein